MKFCDKCRIYIENPREQCPLCQNVLITSDDTSPLIDHYPRIPLFHRDHRFLFNILLFISILSSSISLIVNFFFQKQGWWSVIVTASFLYFWIAVLNQLRTRNSLIGISNSVIILSGLAICIDFMYGFTRWSFNYVIPALFLAALSAVLIISFLRKLRFTDFIIYLVITAFLALLPVVFMLTGLSTLFLPSFICILGGIFSFIAVFIFANSDVLDELKRRFHL